MYEASITIDNANLTAIMNWQFLKYSIKLSQTFVHAQLSLSWTKWEAGDIQVVNKSSNTDLSLL